MKLETEEEKERVVNFGSFGYPNIKIASILEVDEAEIDALMSDENSHFAKLYQKGIDMFDYKLDEKLQSSALGGDLKALKELELRKKRYAKDKKGY